MCGIVLAGFVAIVGEREDGGQVDFRAVERKELDAEGLVKRDVEQQIGLVERWIPFVNMQVQRFATELRTYQRILFAARSWAIESCTNGICIE